MAASSAVKARPECVGCRATLSGNDGWAEIRRDDVRCNNCGHEHEIKVSR